MKNYRRRRIVTARPPRVNTRAAAAIVTQALESHPAFAG